jgi:hypothetical protein
MSVCRNTDEFYRRLLAIGRDYDGFFAPRIETLRKTLDTGSPPLPPGPASELEAHRRAFRVNGLLAVLNWRLTVRPEDGLPPLISSVAEPEPNLVPEVPVSSPLANRRRFLDYLGVESATDTPLLVVETKRAGSPLPLEKSRGRPQMAPYGLTREAQCSRVIEAIYNGLDGEDLNGDWNEWLDSSRDYFRRVAASGSAPRRVLLTDGDWLVIVVAPDRVFGAQQPPRRSADILVFLDAADQLERHDELFHALEHRRVLVHPPRLSAAELGFRVEPAWFRAYAHGLRIRYVDGGLAPPRPFIHVAPVLFLLTRFGTAVRVDATRDFEIPDDKLHLPRHLREVDEVAGALRAECFAAIGTTLPCHTVADHYRSEDLFAWLKGFQKLAGDDQLLALAGEHTHFLMPTPSVTGCPYHAWEAARATNQAATTYPLPTRSLSPRLLFGSGTAHHCAHRQVQDVKSAPIGQVARSSTGLRSGKPGSPFCEVIAVDEFLCCRTCIYQYACESSSVLFRLPCISTPPA